VIWKAKFLQLFSLILMIQAIWTPCLLGQEQAKDPEIVGDAAELQKLQNPLTLG
jgi:hypothetical protein